MTYLVRLALSFATLHLIASPASADWEEMQWGMSPEEVRALASDATIEIEDAPEKRVFGQRHLLSDFEQDKGLDVTVQYFFDRRERELTMIKFLLEDASRCSDAKLHWTKRYGEPEIETIRFDETASTPGVTMIRMGWPETKHHPFMLGAHITRDDGGHAICHLIIAQQDFSGA